MNEQYVWVILIQDDEPLPEPIVFNTESAAKKWFVDYIKDNHSECMELNGLSDDEVYNLGEEYFDNGDYDNYYYLNRTKVREATHTH